ncbi:MAG: hypothetical protein QXG05_03785 [Nitrososphaerota archaeon]
MRKPILMEKMATDEVWPTDEVEAAKESLYKYLADYVPERWVYTKHAIMGPAGKLLGIIAASKFGENVDSYVGYIANIHDQQSKKHLTLEGMNNLKEAVSRLIQLRKRSSERAFLKMLNSVDYGVYYMKIKEIGEKSEAKKAGGENQ